jgi:hypothetical protein
VDRLDPGPGYRHLLFQKDIYASIDLLPDWEELAVGLNAITLAPGSWDDDGAYGMPTGGGILAITATFWIAWE